MVAMNKDFSRFAGIRDKESPLRSEKQDFVGMRTAKNMDIDDNLKIKPAPGFTTVEAVSTEDIYFATGLKRCYIIRDGDLYEYFKNGTATLLRSDVGAAGEWDEVNGIVYFTNGSTFLVINGVSVRDWGMEVPPAFTITTGAGSMPEGDYQITATYRAYDGRESGALAATIIPCTGSLELSNIPVIADHDTIIYLSAPDGDVLYEALATQQTVVTLSSLTEEGEPIATLHLSGPPGGDCLAEHQSRMCLGQYFPEGNISAVWRSEPLGYEFFDKYSDSVILIPGKVNLIGSVGSYMIIGCDDAIYIYSDVATEEYAGGLNKVLEAGSVGRTLAKDVDGQVWFWTNRGAAKAMPFKLITDDYFASPLAVIGAGEIINHGGFSKYNVILTGTTNSLNQYER